MYYADKIEILKDIFGSNELRLEDKHLIVNGRAYSIVDDVIILLDAGQYPTPLKKGLKVNYTDVTPQDFAPDIQFTFGQEWQRFPKILSEHKKEFLQYFDLVDLSELKYSRVCDLGCGMGRWSYFLKDKCRELLLVDFSEAIFVARKNLKGANNIIFFMGDLKRLPFRNDFTDFLFCLGVLHHLPTNALNEIEVLKKYAPTLLVYLYYALDNRPIHFRIFLGMITALRRLVSGIKNALFRSFFTWLMTIFFYLPCIWLGKTLSVTGLSKFIPLYDGYNGKSLHRIHQDVFDRFFTRIEQRFSKKQILALEDTFSNIFISDKLPYWHFMCQR